MVKLVHRIRDRESISRVFAYLVLFWGIVGVGYQTLRSLLGTNPFGYTLITYFYFTTQSNILVIIVASLFLFRQKKSIHQSTLSFITLVNISMTGIVFHTLLTPYMVSVGFINHVLHTINPILYFIFYFLFIKDELPMKKFWIALIYPLLYMSFVYIVIEPVFGDLMDSLMSTFPSARYVYPFLDPGSYQRGVLGLLLFNLGILAPLIVLFSFLLIYSKSRFEHKINAFSR